MIYDIEHLFMSILSIRCVVWFHCCFNLKFPDDLWYWASFHVHIVICICSYGGVCSDTSAILFLSNIFLLLSFKSSLYILDVKWSESHSVLSDSLQPHGLYRLYSPWNSLGQSTGVGTCSLLQRSSQPRDQTQVSTIAGGFFTSWATKEAQEYWSG